MDASSPLKRSSTAVYVPEYMINLVYLVMFVDILAACVSTPAMPYYAEAFGLKTQYIGFLFAAWSFSSAFFAPLISAQADRWGRKRVLVACLYGAGVANLIQGLAIYTDKSTGIWVFLFGRMFSGIWASVGATCNMYITDVTLEGEIRRTYLEKLSMMPVLAIMIGPGIGGGLAAAYGYNFPVMIDGIMTLFSAMLVSILLVETPAFLKMKEQRRNAAASKTQEKDSAVNAPKTPFAVHILGFVNLVAYVASQGNLSMYALFYQHVYGFDTLHVGFLFMGSAVIMLFTQMVILPIFRKKQVPPIRAISIGGVLGGLGNIALGLSQFSRNVYASVSTMFLGSVGGGINMANANSCVAEFTVVENRGKIFSIVQTYQNLGKIAGPILSTHIAEKGVPGIDGFMGLPLALNGCITLLAMFTLCCVRSPVKKVALERRGTKFGDDWEDEKGSKEDIESLGKYVAELLSQRHYKWVTRRSEIEALLDHALPELKVADRESYETSFKAADHYRFV